MTTTTTAATTGKGVNRGWLALLLPAAFVQLAVIGLYEFRIHPSRNGLDEKLNHVVSSLSHPERPTVTIRNSYTGIPGLDYAFTFIVAVFLPSAAGFTEESQIQAAYFLISVLPIVAIFSVEATRLGSDRAWLRYTSIFAILYQSIGGAVIIPIWFLMFVRHSAKPSYHESSLLRLPSSYAKALVPAHILGYLLPTLAVFLPLNDPNLSKKQAFIAIWQFAPIYVNILLVGLAKVFQAIDSPTQLLGSDVKHIKSLYAVCFITSLLSHIALLYQWTQSQWSLTDIFVPRMDFIQGSVPQVIYYIFQVDFAIIFAVALLTTYLVIVDVNTLGKSQVNPVVAVYGVILSTFLLGPAATISAAWWWREGQIRSETRSVDKKGE